MAITALLAPSTKYKITTATGAPLVGGKVYTYLAGTNTFTPTYADAERVTTNTNPVILDARGEANIFLDPAINYKFVVQDSAGASVYTQDNISGKGVVSGVLSAADITYTQSGAGTKTNTAEARLRELGRFASDYTGYDPTGVTDSTAAIQAAINQSYLDKTYTVYITGTPKVSAPLTYTKALALIGYYAGDLFTNDFDLYPTRLICNEVNGYLFDQPDVSDGSGTLAIQNLCLDGRSLAGLKSSVWSGIAKASTTSGESSFYLRLTNVMAGNSLAATAICDLSGEVFGDITNCNFATWWYGLGIRTSGANILGTSISVNKTYFTNLRQVAEFYDNQTDVHFNNCVMESCVVGVAALKSSVTFDTLYSENMGYDGSGTGITTGITPRSFGIADIPAITGNVTAIHTCRYGQMIFNNYTVQNTTGGKKWFDGIGRLSALGQGGLIKINEINLAAGTINTIFTPDADSPTSKADFQYIVTSKNSKAVFTEADARLINSGCVPIQYSDGTIRATEINEGLYTTLGSSFNGFTTMPTATYPNGGAWKVGDQVRLSTTTVKKGFPTSYICSAAGTTAANWDINEFIPSSKFASIAAAGTMAVSATQMNTGDLHTWEVLASDGANIKSFYRVSMQSFSGTGQLNVESLVTTNPLSFSISWGAPYTITITNSSGSTLTIYARLTSMSSANNP